jgi:hypothetical protein
MSAPAIQSGGIAVVRRGGLVVATVLESKEEEGK